MQKIICSLMLLLLSCFSAMSQAPAMSVYAELGGPGIASLNFDSRFSAKEDGLGGRLGIGYFKVDQSSVLFVPVGVNYLLGKDQKNYLEVGGGITFVSEKDNGYSSVSTGAFSTTFGHLWFGYRLQPKNDGITFRAGLNPVFGNGFFIPYYFGISVGYKF